MTRPLCEVEQALALAGSGMTASAVARAVGVPRRTVADWLNGRIPRSVVDGQSADALDLPVEYVHLLGLYLGDGWLSSHPRGVFKLRICLDTAYPGIITETAASMSATVPTSTAAILDRPGNCVEVYSYSKSWPTLFPQHGPGMKHRRAIILSDWQRALVERFPQLLLRGLIQSDGCRFMNSWGDWRCPRYAFSNRSKDIREIFMNACRLVGVRCTEAPHTVYVSRKADVARLDEFIGPKR